jgi:hypothetical protein
MDKDKGFLLAILRELDMVPQLMEGTFFSSVVFCGFKGV